MSEGMKRSKDIKTELLRSIACFMVILVHIRISPLREGEIISTPVLLGCLLAPAVGTFFLLTGFFMYDTADGFFSVLKRFFIRILLPTLFVVILTLIFHDFLMSQASILECFSRADYADALKSTVKGVLYNNSDYWGQLCAHLWYISEYTKLILFFPAVVILVKYAGNRVLLYLVGLNLVFCVLVDLYRQFGQFPFLIAEPFLRSSQALVLSGCLLYRFKEKLKEKKQICPALFIAYVASVLWMFYCQMTQFQREGGDWASSYYTTWLSGIGMLMTILLTAFVLSLPDNWKLWLWMERPVLFMGKLSFPVYLIQYAVVIKLGTSGIMDHFTARTTTPFTMVCYYLFYGFFIYLISAVIVLLVLRMMKLLKIWTNKLR